jgi:DNA-binding beta-propeller fold protein YncE
VADGNLEERYQYATVVEVEDNSRQRGLLAAALIVLMLLLAAVGWLLFRTTKPAGAPTASSTPSGMTWVRSIYAWGKTPEQMLRDPVDTAVGPDGTIWTVSAKTTLVGFAPNGTPRKVITMTRGGQPGQVNSVEGIDVDENGLIYAADYGNNKVIVLDAAGKIVNEWGVELPTELAVRNGRVAVAAAYGIGVFDTDGNPIAKWGSRGINKDQVDLPHGIVWGDDGNIYVSDTDNRRLKAYTPEGRLLWVYPKDREIAKRGGLSTSRAAAKKADSSGVQLPAGMTVDAAGRIVFVDPFEFQVITISESGKLGQRWGDYGLRDGLFAYPTGIAYDPARDYYVVADTANNRLQVFRLPGSGGSVFTRIRSSFDGPIWLCSLPLIFLLIAAALMLKRRRNETKVTDEPFTDSATVATSGV